MKPNEKLFINFKKEADSLFKEYSQKINNSDAQTFPFLLPQFSELSKKIGDNYILQSNNLLLEKNITSYSNSLMVEILSLCRAKLNSLENQ